ncbi:hypothetical protein [Micromonospora sp. NPDC049171]|uniref:hypothetical protein n=1 Tax=Micromonospora sp. NPDC049171 TaxID=3155770 RepID=UPI0033ED128C
MGALDHPGGRYQPSRGRRKPDSDESLVDAVGRIPEQRRANDKLAHRWEGLDARLRLALYDEFKQWYHESGQSSLMRAGHSICGRQGEKIACEAAVKIWARWPDKRMRDLFTTSPRYIYQLVRNLFLDDLRLSHSQHEQAAGLPWSGEDGIWEGKAGADPGWEVRHAINLLEQEKAELIFLMYWLRMRLSEASRHMGVTRGKAERLHDSAITELKYLLKEEA